ncbi:transcriptional regulator [Halorubellus sp. JP-L1]|uniref:helix-turn-helix domain-containing protein n=1 Tax=Halorubellus sp. JP-L1 TaxID=2715753 RepID=UPI0014086A33|nr:helix-turn-helix domain-containing protein [Halorubellus sp. JP-L1]NHN41964.1 transcriptional regulator [Halorubellus sp. JP-L1]
MREYVFTLEYERGVDPIADVFIDHPEAIARSVACNVVGEDMWRIDRFSGPEPAIDALEALVLDANRCNECPEGACDSYREHQLLEHDPTTATVYTYRQGIDACPALPYHATDHLGPGLFFETRRRGDEYVWRILTRNGDGAGELFDAMRENFPDSIGISLSQLSDPTHWGDDPSTDAELPYEQRAALEAAVDAGYYETPRESTLADVAEETGVPRSTLQYRLQRAETWLATEFTQGCLGVEDVDAPEHAP